MALTLMLSGSGCGGGGGGGTSGGGGGGPTSGCGDGKVVAPETCDVGNAKDKDGCSSSCQIEPGWACPAAGQKCVAARCGDGIVAGDETCDDGTATSGHGCSGACQVEDGWVCPTPGQPCRQTICGDGKIEGLEECDDGKTEPYDGCSPTCKLEPSCPNGSCLVAVCGDGIIGNGEVCDDGNRLSNDGCSGDCKTLEDITGVTCTNVTSELPDYIDVPVLYRDFKGVPDCPANTAPQQCHPDFEANFNCGKETQGLVKNALSNGLPVFLKGTTSNTGCSKQQITSADTFSTWYVDNDGWNLPVVSTVRLTKQTAGSVTTYAFDSGSGFFPIDGKGLGNSYKSGGVLQSHDFGFTTEIRYWFTYQGGEKLDFTGDDDVWVFINGNLAVDMGGLHSKREATLTLNAAGGTGDGTTAYGVGASGAYTIHHTLGLTVGQVYELAFFHAERHTTESNFKLSLGGFVKATTTCVTVCGDGKKAPTEECDDGDKNGTAASTCTTECKAMRSL